MTQPNPFDYRPELTKQGKVSERNKALFISVISGDSWAIAAKKNSISTSRAAEVYSRTRRQAFDAWCRKNGIPNEIERVYGGVGALKKDRDNCEFWLKAISLVTAS